MPRRRVYRRKPRRTRPRTLRTGYIDRFGRRRNLLRMPRGLNIGIHHFKRTQVMASIQTSIVAGTNTHQAMSFKFSDLPNYTEFTTLFDQYRMNKFVLKLVPSFTGSEPTSAGAYYQMPNVWSVIDYDDAIDAGNNLISLFQYPNCKMTRGQKVHTRTWTPSILLDAYTGGTVGGAVNFKKWLNMGDVNIPHYGIKLWIDQTGTTSPVEYRVFFTAYFSCKGVR